MLKPEDLRLRHRDLNWLSFNERVLQEAQDHKNPLYERMKFLSIFSSNLDEYFRVRVSQLRQIKRVEKSIRKKLALKPSKKVKEILAIVTEHQQKFGNIFYDEIIPELKENGILLIGKNEFSDSHKEFARDHFQAISHLVEPRLIDTEAENQLFLENNSLYLLANFKNEEKLGIVNLPTEEIERFVQLPSEAGVFEITFIDDIIKFQLPQLFPNLDLEGIYEIKLSRDAELYIDDEFEGILAEKIYQSLQQRNEGQPTRLLYDARMPKEVQKALRKLLTLGKIDMMPGGEYHNFNDFVDFPDPTGNPELHYKPFTPVTHKVLEDADDYFEEISKKDMLVHSPYMSFKYVERFLQQAATDKRVTAIKISIYRIADESELTSSLLAALKEGKKITVFIEAKARFDEKNNIDWGHRLEEHGARVIYSYPKIKVHSKILLIQREENNQIKNYAYIGTGNFNSKTSRIYCDHALFTSHEKISEEISRVFNVLEGELIIPREKHLLISPFSTRKAFSDMIRREMFHAQQGKKAKITAKLNSLDDTEIIALLYEASNAGVQIRLLVRGFTCLVAGVPGLSENIYITSIVDRFLEHGRVYLFENDGQEEIYFGSADLMSRNLDRRIEVIAPLYDEDIALEMKEILEIQMKDNVKARIQDASESNEYVKPKPGEKAIRSQEEIYYYLKEKHQS